MSDVLNVKGLNVEFKINGNFFKAVKDVSFSIKAGETLGLVGESGCGKSVTSLSLIRLLTKSAKTSGEVLYQGKNLLPLSTSEMQAIRGKEISMIFQEPMTSLNPVYKIGAQISEMLRIHEHLSVTKARERSLEMLKKVGISRPEQILDGYPHQLSGGMRQRVMIAIAMICNPKLLIADEPTTALDVTIQAQILDLMRKLSTDFGTSVLLITHDLGVVAEMCDRVAVMYAGQIVEQGTTKEVFAKPTHPYTRGLLNAIPKIDNRVKERLQPIDGNVPSLTRMPQGCRFAARCPMVMDRCKTEAPDLYDFEQGHLSRCFLNETKAV